MDLGIIEVIDVLVVELFDGIDVLCNIVGVLGIVDKDIVECVNYLGLCYLIE